VVLARTRRAEAGRGLGRAALAALAVALALAAGGAAAGSDPIEVELARAAALLEGGRPAEAAALYASLAERFPGLADAREGLAAALAAQGRTADAAAALVELGQGWLGAGDARTASVHLERAVALAPESASAHAALGRALLQTQAFAGSTDHLARAAALGDGSLATRLLLATALWENHRVVEAEALLREAAAGGNPAPRHQLGRLLLWQGRHEEALAVLAPLAAEAPPAVGLTLDLAQALEGVGRVEEAVVGYRHAAALAPDESLPHYRLGILLRRLGEPEEAAAATATYRRLRREEEERVRRQGLERARLDRGWDLLRTGKREEAIEHFAALAATPESLRGLGLSFSAAGRHGEAAAALERALLLAPEDRGLALLLADERAAAAPP
jgi:tetratricopeptide (TPR) repeat protein